MFDACLVVQFCYIFEMNGANHRFRESRKTRKVKKKE